MLLLTKMNKNLFQFGKTETHYYQKTNENTATKAHTCGLRTTFLTEISLFYTVKKLI